MAVNRPDSTILVFDKVVFSEFLNDCGVPQPARIGGFGLTYGRYDVSAPARVKAEFERFVAESKRQNFFLKPVEGRAGIGHISVGAMSEDGPEWELLPLRERITVAQLSERIAAAGTAYMAQERMVPHPGLSCFGTDVLHTIRFITILEGDVRIVHAALKIGTGVTPMDNTMKGNSVAGIDLATGVLRPGFAMDTSGQIAVPVPADVHPVTKSRIGGHQLPLWDETLEMLKRAAPHFHTLSVLTWDVAITDRGPVVIEANTNPDLFLTQMANDEGLLATPLGDYFHRHGLLDRIGAGVGLKAVYERAARGERHSAAAQAGGESGSPMSPPGLPHI
jgi:hypothetical protein